MPTILTFAVLGLLVVAGAWAVDRARRFASGDDRREGIESLTELIGFGELTSDERRAVTLAVEGRLQQL